MNNKVAHFDSILASPGINFDIDCQLVSCDVTKFNEKGNRYQDCVLSDGVENQKVKVWEGRNGLPFETKNIGQTLTFTLSARVGTGKWQNQKYLGGFWNSSAPIAKPAQNQQQAPPNAPKTPQNAPQSTKSVGKEEMSKEEWDAKELREKRGYAIRDAVLVKTTLATVSNNIASYLSEDDIFALAEKFVQYVYHGILDNNKPNKEYYEQGYGSQRNPGEEQPETGSDMPETPPDDSDLPF